MVGNPGGAVGNVVAAAEGGLTVEVAVLAAVAVVAKADAIVEADAVEAAVVVGVAAALVLDVAAIVIGSVAVGSLDEAHAVNVAATATAATRRWHRTLMGKESGKR
jgi:hypothetical protein